MTRVGRRKLEWKSLQAIFHNWIQRWKVIDPALPNGKVAIHYRGLISTLLRHSAANFSFSGPDGRLFKHARQNGRKPTDIYCERPNLELTLDLLNRARVGCRIVIIEHVLKLFIRQIVDPELAVIRVIYEPPAMSWV